jgi:N utilization substance protein B
MATKTATSDAAPRSSRSARRRARELAVQGVYEWLVGGQDAAAIEGHLLETRGAQGYEELEARADMAHYRELLHGAIDGAGTLRAHFAPHLDRDVAALSPVEHGILLLATYELAHRPEIPYRVVINEAVELAKSFGGTEGFKYVNGVLDKVAAQLRPAEVAARA